MTCCTAHYIIPPTHKFSIVILIAHALSFIVPLSNRFDDTWICIMNMSHIYILYTLCSKTDIQYYNLKEIFNFIFCRTTFIFITAGCYVCILKIRACLCVNLIMSWWLLMQESDDLCRGLWIHQEIWGGQLRGETDHSDQWRTPGIKSQQFFSF